MAAGQSPATGKSDLASELGSVTFGTLIELEDTAESDQMGFADERKKKQCNRPQRTTGRTSKTQIPRGPIHN